jgi:predicted PurR-regulated permease PerM
MNLNLTTATRIGLNLCAVLGIAALLKLGSSLFVPLILSLLLASILYPVATFLHDKIRLPWFFSCLTTLLATVALFLAAFIAFAIAIPQTIVDLPQKEEQWKQRYRDIQRNLVQIIPFKTDSWFPPEPEENQGIYGYIKAAFSQDNVLAAAGKIGLLLLEYVWQAILIMFITLFLLLEGQMLTDKVRAIFGPSRSTQTRITNAGAEMAQAIRTYLVWRTIVNMGLALVLGLVYQAAGLQYWYLWALLVAVFSYVPYLGTIAAGIPPILDAFLFVSPTMGLGIGVFYTGVVTFEGYIIVPWVMGRSMDLNATTVLLSCLFWELIWGIPGLFLAMPLMAALKAVCTQVDGWQQWGDLMSSGPAKPLRFESDPDLGRLEDLASVNGEATAIMDVSETSKEGRPRTGEPKSDGY